jgi:excisionase family DNA binding protein
MSEIFFTTNDAASMLNVDKSTIKRWTDEGKLKCFRSPGGHRKFKADDLYSFMSQLNDGNSKKQTLPKFINDQFIIRSIVLKEEYNILHSVCFSASIKGKKDEVIELCTEVYHAGSTLASMFDKILMPTIKKIESLSLQHKLTMSEYRLAQNVLSSAVVQLNDSLIKREKNFRTIVCASCGIGTNDIELKALSTLLEVKGYTVMNLGAGMNVDALNRFLIRMKPFAIFLYESNSENKKMLSNEIETIVTSAKINGAHCVIGGTGFNNPSMNKIEGLNICSSFMDFDLIQFNSVKEFEKINR